tara:strand:- start:199 stop:1869 length:1671 start_codon:yes stop_codon:yes gene_type:complete
MHRKIVIGPPGTGKTTFLKNKVKEFLDLGTPPTEIAYLSFTVKAAEEIRDRIMGIDTSSGEKVGDNVKKMFPFFCTLHSLCYKQLRLRSDDIMDEDDYESLSNTTKRTYVNKMKKGNGLDIAMPTPKSEYQDIINLAYAKYPDNEDKITEILKYRKVNDEGARDIIRQMHEDLTEYKKENRKLEYHDYFINFLKEEKVPKLKYLLIDEAQDLSAHQWQVVDKIQRESGAIETYVAGDDDQAIFRWAGADIENFIDMANQTSGNEIIQLQQSYRIPLSVHSLATKLAHNISRRVQKEYLPRQDAGAVKVLNIRPLGKYLQDGDWLILCRTHAVVQEVVKSLVANGCFFKLYGKNFIKYEYIKAIKCWTQLCRGEKVIGADVVVLYQHMDSTRINRPHGNFKGEPSDMFNMEILCQHFGLKRFIEFKTQDDSGDKVVIQKDVSEVMWYDMLNGKAIRKQEAYLRNILESGFKLDQDPKIEVSTMHASKGGERQKVMLISDLSYGPYNASVQSQEGRDDEARVFYVAATRAKEELHLIRQTSGQYEYEPLFIAEREREK